MALWTTVFDLTPPAHSDGVYARQGVPASLSRLASFQAGVVSREQALESGLSRHALPRLVRETFWRQVCRGIYLIDGRLDWEALAWSGILVAGESSRLGGLAAGYACRLVDEAPDLIEIWLPDRGDLPRRQPASMTWCFRREAAGVRARSVGSPPRLGVENTVLDLVSASTSQQAVGWVSTAVQRRLTTPRRLLATLDQRDASRHRNLLRSVLLDVATGAESPLEVAYLRKVERAHALPRARRQAQQRGTRIDVLYEEFGLVVELDGRLGHTGSGRFRDMARDNRSAGAGLLTLRYGWSDVDGQPCRVALQVERMLALRGWAGQLTPCLRCRGLQLATWTG